MASERICFIPGCPKVPPDGYIACVEHLAQVPLQRHITEFEQQLALAQAHHKEHHDQEHIIQEAINSNLDLMALDEQWRIEAQDLLDRVARLDTKITNLDPDFRALQEQIQAFMAREVSSDGE